MTLHEQLQEVFRTVFDDQTLVLTDELSPQTLNAWDSMMHVNLMFSIESTFGIQFAGNQLADLKSIASIKTFLETKGYK